jgi:hypothetical protein
MVTRWTMPAGVTGDVGGGVTVAVLALVTTPGAAAMDAASLTRVGVSAGRFSSAAGVTGDVGGGWIVTATTAGGRRVGSAGLHAESNRASENNKMRGRDGRLKRVLTWYLSWAGEKICRCDCISREKALDIDHIYH